MIDCNFDNDAMACQVCGFVAGGRDWRRNCPGTEGVPAFVADVQKAAKLAGVTLPIGDWTEAGLAAISITKERVAEWTGGDCVGCGKRQEWLNKLGGKLASFFSSPPAT